MKSTVKVMNNFLFDRQKRLYLEPGNQINSNSRVLVNGIILEAAKLGYAFDGTILSVLKTYDADQLADFRLTFIEWAKASKGATVRHVPLFKKFPDNVPDDEEFFIKRIVGWFTQPDAPELLRLLGYSQTNHVDTTTLECGHIIDNTLFDLSELGACPICLHASDTLRGDTSLNPGEIDEYLDDCGKLIIVRFTPFIEVFEIFTKLLRSKVSLTPDDITFIETMIDQGKGKVRQFLPDDIPFKENVATIIGAFDRVLNEKQTVTLATKLVKTATDVLRVATAFSGGDVSLAKNTKFKLSNRQRRVLMMLLDTVSSPLEDMNHYRNKWLRLGEVIHAGNFAKRTPSAFAAFDKIRNAPEEIRSYNSKLEQLVDDAMLYKPTIAHCRKMVKLLKQRPGVFGRRLDMMLRVHSTPKMSEHIIDEFEKIANQIETPMALMMISNFRYRSSNPIRVFLPKGQVRNFKTDSSPRDQIKQQYCDHVVDILTTVLKNRFSELGDMGKVFIDPDINGILLPMSQRNASSGLVSIPRGSKVPLACDTEYVRLFVYWKDIQEGMDSWNNSRVDVDLSVINLDSDFKFHSQVSYHGYSDGSGIVFSGDITSAPDGASEFLDVNIQKCLSNGIRYIGMQVYSYTGQPFDDYECFAGVMERDRVRVSDNFNPKLVTTRFDVNGQQRTTTPVIFDLLRREFIYVDIGQQGRGTLNNIDNRDGAMNIIEAMVSNASVKPTLSELLHLHCESRNAEILPSPPSEDDADVRVYNLESLCKLEDIVGELLI